MYKKDIINFLFVLSFPLYGFGNYVSASMSPSVGYFVSVSAHLLIIFFYVVDLAYRREFSLKITGWFFAGMLLLAFNVTSLVRALLKGLPDENPWMTVSKTVMLAAPFLAFVIVGLYNRNDNSRLPRLTFISLSLLIFINLVGFFVLGLSNEVHSIENRLNFPFLDGFYSGACVLSILNLMIVYYLRQRPTNPVKVTALIAYFAINSVLLFLINSRINILIFFAIAVLLAAGLLNKARGLFIASLFTIPVLLASGVLLFEILSLPGLSSILQRVDLEDVTTFNGRSYIWENAMNWLLHDQTGILTGNGYKGHYFLDLISDVAIRWNEKDVHHMHLHSTSLELLTSQGILGLGIFLMVVYRLLTFYRRQYTLGRPAGVFFGVIVFLLFILQVDIFLYLESSGGAIFALLFSGIVVRDTAADAARTATNIPVVRPIPV
jgi:hypothetical protein